MEITKEQIDTFLNLYERYVIVQERVLEMSLKSQEYGMQLAERNIEMEKERRAKEEQAVRVARLQAEEELEIRAALAETVKKFTDSTGMS